jgi:hypothetical protein
MEIITLATAALALAKPFLENTGEGIARKVGEDVWNLIKSPFVKKGDIISEDVKSNDLEIIKTELINELSNNEEFKNKLEESVLTAQQQLNGNFQQNVKNESTIDKQINIQTNSGNIQM